MNNSILTREFLQEQLDIAKQFLTEGQEVMHMLFIKLHGVEKIIVAPVPLNTDQADMKKMIMYLVGEALRKQFSADIEEVVFLSDTFYMEAQDAKDHLKNFDGLISQNPNRKEALMVMGRNKLDSVSIWLRLPYERIKGQLLFKEPEFMENTRSSGIIDFLFSLQEAMLKSKLSESVENTSHTKHVKN